MALEPRVQAAGAEGGGTVNLVEKAEELLGQDHVTAMMGIFLNNCSMLCREQGGSLESRQAIAIAIATAEALYGKKGIAT